MNTRLEIASRVMAGILSDPSIIGNHEVIAKDSLAYADALIKLDSDTRVFVPKIAGTLVDYAKDVSDALIAYRENPSSKTQGDLRAAEDAMKRYCDRVEGGSK